MKRVLLVLAVVASFLAGAAMVSNADAPVAYREYQGSNVVRDWNPLPGTPCLTAGGNRRMAPLPGGALAQCTPTTSTTIKPTTTTIAPTTTVASTTTTTAATTTAATTTVPATSTTSTTLPGNVQFSETFDNNAGLNRFRWGVYNRSIGYREMDQPEPFSGVDNNSPGGGSWTGDHDLNCGPPDTQRQLKAEGTQDTTGANGWLPTLDFHTDELLYTCVNHMMSSMGETSGFTILWFAPNVSFPTAVNSVSFDVNLTDLGARKWWKVGVVSDGLWNSTCQSDEFAHPVPVRCVVMSDVGSSNVAESLQGADRLIATWGGGASGGYPGCLKIGDPATGVCTGQNNDKMTRYPVSLTDNHNGTVTFTVNGTSITRPGSFPACPCHVVFYDQNYTPDKDGVPIGHTWHWDSIVVR